MTILLVDDTSENLYFLEKLLQGNGYETVSAVNGADALTVAVENPPDLIITDILMPVMDGFTLCRHWRQHEMLNTIPLIFYTATYTDPKDEEFALSLGADRFIIKPADIDEFLHIVRETLNEYKERVDLKDSAPAPEETIFMREYNEALVRKLEKKTAQVESAEKKLREKNAALEKDVAERKRVEKELRLSEGKFRRLHESMMDGFVRVDLTGRIVEVNQAYIAMLGYSEAELSSFTYEQITPDRWHGIERNIVAGQIMQRGYSDVYEKEYIKKDGTILPVELRTTLIKNERGENEGMWAIVRDISAQKTLQKELLQAQKMESIGTLAGGIAHDFNNILAIIMGYSTLLEKRREHPEKFAECVRTINQAAERGASLVRQILTFARQSESALAYIDLADVITELLSMLQTTFPKIITITSTIEDGLPLVYADHTQIHQALLNLCVNARDAMPNGGTMAVTVGQCLRDEVQALVSDAADDRYLYIRVMDTGAGMDAATRQRVFDPFFTTKESGKGTGLGLSVVLGIMQSHKGFVDLESQKGRGTTFSLYLPVPQKQEGIPYTGKSSICEVRGGCETILVVEDEESLLQMICQILAAHGYQFLVARDGMEAVSLYERHKDEIAVVLTDLGLPVINGVNEFARLKEINPRVKVIMVSGFFEPGIHADLLRSGIKGFVQKPYSSEEILRSIRQVLDEEG